MQAKPIIKKVVNRVHRTEHYLAVMYAGAEAMELRFFMFYVSVGLVVVGVLVEVAQHYGWLEEI